MARELNSGRKGVAKGTAKQVVVFVHGYGADGNDLLGLADPLMPHMPGTAFYSPDAPESCTNNPMGFQWFPIPWLDGSSEEDAEAGMRLAEDDLNAFIDHVLAEEGLTPDRLALVGFSQGTMISLQVAPRRDAPIGALVGFSGRLMAPEMLVDEARVKMPVLLLHGDQDDVVPFASLEEAADTLVAAEFEVYAFVMKGTGHGIGHDGLGQALGFLRMKLGLEPG